MKKKEINRKITEQDPIRQYFPDSGEMSISAEEAIEALLEYKKTSINKEKQLALLIRKFEDHIEVSTFEKKFNFTFAWENE